ncbi:hypothetical protein PsWM33_03757 [Pseudovibrio sp. WM33]|nr:hypothetical protein PsWM33_03757 [Pseudovibrio sp. WM33]
MLHQRKSLIKWRGYNQDDEHLYDFRHKGEAKHKHRRNSKARLLCVRKQNAAIPASRPSEVVEIAQARSVNPPKP